MSSSSPDRLKVREIFFAAEQPTRLGAHVGTRFSHKSPFEGENVSFPKFEPRYVSMWFPQQPDKKENQNRYDHLLTSVLFSQIGAALVGEEVCPRWKAVNLRLPTTGYPSWNPITVDPSQGILFNAVATPFIEGFSTLGKRNPLPSKEDEYGFHKLADQEPKKLASRGLFSIFALNNLLANEDFPAWNLTIQGSEEDGPFMLTDIDGSGSYNSFSSEKIRSTVDQPLSYYPNNKFFEEKKYYCYSPYPCKEWGEVSHLIEKFNSLVKKVENDSDALRQHYQVFFSAALLPVKWIEQEFQKVGLPCDYGQGHGQYTAQFTRALEDSEKFKPIFEEHHESFLREALKHFRRVNLRKGELDFRRVENSYKAFCEKLKVECKNFDEIKDVAGDEAFQEYLIFKIKRHAPAFFKEQLRGKATTEIDWKSVIEQMRGPHLLKNEDVRSALIGKISAYLSSISVSLSAITSLGGESSSALAFYSSDSCAGAGGASASAADAHSRTEL